MSPRHPELHVYPDAAALAQGAAERIATALARAVAERGRAGLALAGGSTPRAAYAALASDGLRRRVDWGRVVVAFGDERCVPPDHPDSNYRMARETLLEPLARAGTPPAAVLRMEGERDDLGVAARDYERRLREALCAEGAANGEPPRLDVVLLGLGEDGHTASIFPDVVPITRGPALVARVKPRTKNEWRLTLTLAALDAARLVLFLVSGAGKARILAQFLAREGGDASLPASLVRPRDGERRILADRAAAGETGSRDA